MNWRRLYPGIISVLIFLTGAGTILAQTTAGEVKGVVTDPSKAVIPDVNVTLQNLDTNVQRKAQSNESGIYSFPSIPPGNYQLTLEKADFQSWTAKLTLQVQQVAVLDIVLQVGEINSSIDVADATPVIAAESSSVGTVTDFKRIQQLPLDGRDVLSLLQLTPGVQGLDVPREDGTITRNIPGNAPDAPRINGLKAGGADFLQDGMSIGDSYSGSITRIRPGMDTIQEFKIDMGSTAQYQKPNTISIVTRSGGNALHGSIFETHRNNAAGLRARSREDGEEPGRLLRNEFGATAGGPVILPKLYNGKEKTFWFFSYEGQRRRTGQTYFGVVPTEAMWNGDFSGLVNEYGQPITIYDPATTDANGIRQPFPNNIIPADRHRSNMFLYLKDHTPRPTNSVSPLQGDNWAGAVPESYNQNTFTTKMDHHISDKNLITGRLSIGNGDSTGFFGTPPAPDLSYNVARTLNKLYNGSITYTHIFSPNMLNELLVAGQRSNSQRGSGRDDVYWTEALGVANPLGEKGWPTLTAKERKATFVWDSENRQPQLLNNITVDDNLTLIKNTHDFRFGFRIRDERNNTRGVQQAQGRYGFAQGYTGLWDPVNEAGIESTTGSGMASMLLGYGEYFAVRYNRPFYYLRQKEYGFYAQDSWKVTPRFTLNYGLRYDYWTPYSEAGGRLLAIDAENFQNTRTVITPTGHPMESLGAPSSLLESYAAGGMTWATADKAGYPDKLLLGDKKDFGPRIGAAFKLNDKTVLRGGYGIYYWTMPLSQLLQDSGSSAPLDLRYQNEIYYAAGGNGWDDWRIPYIPGVSVDDPVPVDINNPQSTSSPFAFVPWDKQWRNNRAQEWNFTIEREIMPLTSLRLSYVGNHGSNLDQTVILNSPQSSYLYATSTGMEPPGTRELAPNPFWQYLPLRSHVGYSNSHSLQANIERKYNKGLAFQWYYVFSRSLSTTDGEGYASQPGQVVPSPQIIPGGGSLDKLLRLVYYNVSSVPKHQMRWNVVYDLPFGRTASGFLGKALGGWQVASIGSFRTGSWLNPVTDGYPWNEWYAYDSGYWLKEDPRLSSDQRKVINYAGQNQRLYFKGIFDTTGIAGMENYQPAFGKLSPDGSNKVPVQLNDGTVKSVIYDVYNSMPRNFIEGPKSWLTDFSVVKNFRVKESMNVRFATDFFNLFNHPNDVNPDQLTGLVNLGQQWNDPRTIQFSLRFDF